MNFVRDILLLSMNSEMFLLTRTEDRAVYFSGLINALLLLPWLHASLLLRERLDV